MHTVHGLQLCPGRGGPGSGTLLQVRSDYSFTNGLHDSFISVLMMPACCLLDRVETAVEDLSDQQSAYQSASVHLLLVYFFVLCCLRRLVAL